MNQDYNYNQEPQYQAPQPQPQPKKAKGVSVAALVCGITCFFCNPCYIVCLAAIICGIVGIATSKEEPKGMAIAGLCLGIAGIICQFIADAILSVFTMGTSFLF